MRKYCDFCFKKIGLFSPQAHEVDKEGLCLCKKCYTSLWKEQDDIVSQWKKLARIALNGGLEPAKRQIVVQRVKELVSIKAKTLTNEVQTNELSENSVSESSQEIKLATSDVDAKNTNQITTSEKPNILKEQNGIIKKEEMDLPKSESISSDNGEKQTSTKQLISYIDIKTLKMNETGHFTSNYVCVIGIDDGRCFIDYHYSDNPIKYGEGRLFAHSWIKGVNYASGRKYIKEGRDRLFLIAVYDCESKIDAEEKYRIVLQAYKQEYGSKVLFNKTVVPMEESILSNKDESQVDPNQLISYIDIKTLKRNETDYFTSNYVCVIGVNDGRCFIDYHYSNNQTKYNIKSVFSQSHIKGVNYADGKVIKGGNNRLFLIAIYDCESKTDAEEKYRVVLQAYKQEYGNRVLFNREPVLYYEDDPNMVLSCFNPKTTMVSDLLEFNPKTTMFSDLLGFNPKTTMFSDLSEFKTILENYSEFTFNVYMSNHGKKRKHRDEFDYIDGGVKNNGDATISFFIRPKENDSILTFESENGSFKIENPWGVNKSFNEFILSIKSYSFRDDFESLPTIKKQFDFYINILEGNNLLITTNNGRVLSFGDVAIKKLIEMLKIGEFLYDASQKKYESDRKQWYEKQEYQSIEENEARKLTYVKPISSNLKDGFATIAGSNGEEYNTTLFSCSCMAFKRTDYDKQSFTPCKHIRWLAQKSGKVDFKILPEPLLYTEDPIVEMILKERNRFSFGSSDFTAEYVDGWKWPLLAFKKTMYLYNVNTSKSYPFKMWLNRHNMIVDTDVPFYDDYGGDLYFEDDNEKIGTLFHDNGRTGYFKIDNEATTNIYRELLSSKQFDVCLKIRYGKMDTYYISFPKVYNFANAYYKQYPDAIEKYYNMKEELIHPKQPEPFSKRYQI